MAVTVLDCDVITPGPYSLNWGAPGIKDVYIHTYIFIYLGALGIKSFSCGKDIYSFPGELLSRNWYYCCIGIIIWFCHSLRNIKEEVALLV